MYVSTNIHTLLASLLVPQAPWSSGLATLLPKRLYEHTLIINGFELTQSLDSGVRDKVSGGFGCRVRSRGFGLELVRHISCQGVLQGSGGSDVNVRSVGLCRAGELGLVSVCHMTTTDTGFLYGLGSVSCHIHFPSIVFRLFGRRVPQSVFLGSPHKFSPFADSGQRAAGVALKPYLEGEGFSS